MKLATSDGRTSLESFLQLEEACPGTREGHQRRSLGSKEATQEYVKQIEVEGNRHTFYTCNPSHQYLKITTYLNNFKNIDVPVKNT